jgi:hypothetical protein
VLTLQALKTTLLSHHNFASFDAKRQSFNQYPGYFGSCCLDDSSKSLARYPHTFSRTFVVELFEIRQPDRLIFVDGQNNLFQHQLGDSSRLKDLTNRLTSHSAATSGPRHRSFSLHYKHMLIAAIISIRS